MNLTQFCIPENSLENFDTYLQIFYHEVVSKELDLSKTVNVTRVKKAYKKVVHAYKKETVDSNTSEILFDSPEKRCAYVLKHCPCFTSAVAKHFLQLLRKNPGVLDQALRRRQINLCCLGGGPGTEAVAIVKIVDLLKNSAFLRNEEKIHLSVTEVDLSEDWKTTAEKILRSAQRNPEFCDSAKVQICFNLIKADLTEPLSEKVRRTLTEADIISMVYFVSAVNGSKNQGRCVTMLQNIMHQAKPGVLLFFLDSSKEIHYHSIMESVRKCQNLRLVYGPSVQEFHTLSMKSIKTFIKLYFSQFSAFLCLTNCFTTCVGWTKENCFIEHLRHEESVVDDDGEFSSTSNFRIQGNRKWYKKKVHNSRMQERFRQRVEKLILSEMKMNFETCDWEENDCMFDMEFYFYDKKIVCAGKAKRKRITLAIE